MHSGLGQLAQFRFIQHGRANLQQAGRFRNGLQQVAAPSQVHFQRHHQLFAQGVDRWVRHLSKPLLEVVVEQVGASREHRQGDVIAHAVGRLLTVGRHVHNHQINVLGGVAKGRLVLQQATLIQGFIGGEGLGG